MNSEPISVLEAKQLLENRIRLMPVVLRNLSDLNGHYLAENIPAISPIPAFDQSNRDGYAVRHADIHNGPLKIVGSSAAGEDRQLTLLPQTAMRIFTGAPLPVGADTVLMQEYVTVEGLLLTYNKEPPPKGEHVRKQGVECLPGELILANGMKMNPAAIGLLAAAGIDQIKVFRKPKVSLLITGNELQTPGHPLQFGQVYDANAPALLAALQQSGISNLTLQHLPDDVKAISQAIADVIDSSDCILLTGGVSVGDYDFVVAATIAAGADPIFHKVLQRPGKPLFAAARNNCLVFGLPGNPGSVLTCFYQYVYPALLKMMGSKELPLWIDTRLAVAYQKPMSLTCFVRGFYNGKTVLPLDGQESFRLRSFAAANALIQLEAGKSTYLSGEAVRIQLLPA